MLARIVLESEKGQVSLMYSVVLSKKKQGESSQTLREE